MLLPSNGTADCDPGQPLYEYRNFAWVVGDSLSLLASIIVLCAVSASSELHALAARRSVINLCICDIVFHASDLIFTPVQIFYGWDYACRARRLRPIRAGALRRGQRGGAAFDGRRRALRRDVLPRALRRAAAGAALPAARHMDGGRHLCSPSARRARSPTRAASRPARGPSRRRPTTLPASAASAAPPSPSSRPPPPASRRSSAPPRRWWCATASRGGSAASCSPS